MRHIIAFAHHKFRRFARSKPNSETLLVPAAAVLGRIAVAIVSTVWLTTLPAYLLIIYMLQEKFFSYEIFQEGFFAIKIFIFLMIILFIVLSGYLWAFLGTAKLARRHHAKHGNYGYYRILTGFLCFTTIMLHGFLSQWSIDVGQPILVFLVSGLSFFLVCVWYSSIGKSLFWKLLEWGPLALFILVSVSLPVMFREPTAKLVGVALANFNAGGGVAVQIYKADDGSARIYDGKLLLLAPKHAYFRDKQGRLQVFEQNESTSLVIGEP